MCKDIILKKCSAKGCNNKFPVYNSLQKYCSSTCAQKATLRNKVTAVHKSCAECGRQFEQLIPLQKFCSGICARLNADKRQAKKKKSKVTLKRCLSVKIKQISTKKAKADKILEQNKLKLKEQILDNFGYLVCEHCGKSKCGTHFEVHHIVWRSEEQSHKNLHDIANLLHLGSGSKGACHELFHKKKATRNEYVKSRKLHILFDNQKYVK